MERNKESPVKTRIRSFSTLLLTTLLLASPAATATQFSRATILDVLSGTKGAEALVAAVLLVDEAGVAAVGLADLLGNRSVDLIVFAPSNAAFERLLELETGSLTGLSIEQIKNALPGLLPTGIGPREVSAILAKHTSIARKTSRYTTSSGALLRAGSVTVVDGSEFPIVIGSSGVEVNFETTIIRPDVWTRNGHIHFVDTVIVDGLLDE